MCIDSFIWKCLWFVSVIVNYFCLNIGPFHIIHEHWRIGTNVYGKTLRQMHISLQIVYILDWFRLYKMFLEFVLSKLISYIRTQCIILVLLVGSKDNSTGNEYRTERFSISHVFPLRWVLGIRNPIGKLGNDM